MFRKNENVVVILAPIKDDETIVDIHIQNHQKVKNDKKSKAVKNMTIY